MGSMINDLKNTAAFPEETSKVDLIQTHISYVFVCDKFVYKIKKPVNFGFLDFSTLELREKFCRKEVELNSRFSTDVYLGVYPVIFDGSTHTIGRDERGDGGGEGKIVEYAVKMRRLSDDDLMKSRFAAGTITDDDIKNIAGTIAEFHRTTARSNEIDKFGEIPAVRFNVDECFEQTEKYIGDPITKEQFNDLRAWTDKFYIDKKELFEQRIPKGRIRDCHGDLHMEHVCLTDPVILIDCIEFNERFRYSDTASDIAFLLMDLEFNGGFDQAKLLYSEYVKQMDEADISELVTFYKVYRAYVRGKVNSFLLSDPDVPLEKKDQVRETAKRYFKLAHSYIE